MLHLVPQKGREVSVSIRQVVVTILSFNNMKAIQVIQVQATTGGTLHHGHRKEQRG